MPGDLDSIPPAGPFGSCSTGPAGPRPRHARTRRLPKPHQVGQIRTDKPLEHLLWPSRHAYSCHHQPRRLATTGHWPTRATTRHGTLLTGSPLTDLPHPYSPTQARPDHVDQTFPAIWSLVSRIHADFSRPFSSPDACTRQVAPTTRLSTEPLSPDRPCSSLHAASNRLDPPTARASCLPDHPARASSLLVGSTLQRASDHPQTTS
jgi:hypothetical protein